MSAFQILMVITFIGAIAFLFAGIFNLGADQGGSKRSTTLMFTRLAFSIALLLEIIIYIAFIR